MLELKNICKEYNTGAESVHALRGIDLAFRESEFVSILGPSGCGKTTMLNILGGLDQYSSGDLVIDGISTKEYKDADWDAYRNDTIGFVFQSYNLISHQTVLSNVELALTLSGVSPSERRKRAVVALEQVGLGDQIYKKPAQMSGGQVQRVAIARALINDPDIILADEPTGALDSETSIQVMSILKEIASRKLVIMVTHNPELAAEYSTRIVRLSDGRVISDTDPFTPGEAPEAAYDPGVSRRRRRRRNRSMSMATALQLSLNNLMTKKARTLLTAFAGSIGIIGIALILSVSSGFQSYIDKLEEDTLSSYPLRIQSETADITSMITAFASGEESDDEEKSKDDKIHEQQVMAEMLGSIGSNDLTAFKKYIDSNIGTIGKWFNDYEYNYGISPTIYSVDMKYGPLRVSPGSIMQSYMNSIQTSMVSYANTDVFFQMINNQELLQSQYRILAGKWPEKYDELILVLQDEDQLNDYIAYTLGLRDPQELKDMINEVMKGNDVEIDHDPLEWTYDDFIGKEFALVSSSDLYRRNTEYNVWEDMSDDDDYMKDLIKRSEKIHISGIVCPIERSGANAMSMGIGYLPSLTMHMIENASESDIVKIQLEDKNTDVFSGKTFEDIRNKTDEGLGFDDMIGIDQDKLARAFGGNIDPEKLRAAIRKTGDEELEALVDADSAEKVEADVTDAVRAGCEGMNSYIIKQLLKQAKKDPSSMNIDDAMVAKALSRNLDTGDHKAVVNAFLKAYAEILKKSGAQVIETITAGLSSTQDPSGNTRKNDVSEETADNGSGSKSPSAEESGASDAKESGQQDKSSKDESGSGDASGEKGSGSNAPVPSSDQPSASDIAKAIKDQTGIEFTEEQVEQMIKAASAADISAPAILGAAKQAGLDITEEQAEQIAALIQNAADSAAAGGAAAQEAQSGSSSGNQAADQGDADDSKADDSKADDQDGSDGKSSKDENGALDGSDPQKSDQSKEKSGSSGSSSVDEGAAAVAEAIRQQTGLELSDAQISRLIQAAQASPLTADTIKAAAQQTGLSLTDEQAGQLASVINSAAGAAGSAGSQGSTDTDIPAPDPSDMLQTALETAFSQITEGMLSADDTVNGIRQYADGIEMMQFAGEVYPALGEVAQTVGKQFNIDPSAIADAFSMKMSEDDLTRLISAYMSGDDDSSYESNLRKLGYANLDNPVQISLYFKDFDSKEAFLGFIDDYNKDMQDSGKEDLVISYTDITGVMMKSVKTITNAVSYVLIAFVAISLIVSSIMIGVITYISVLERTKEIGILRAIGASKRDISRIFNAETIIVGLCAGLIGIGASILLLIPINRILIGLTGLQSLKAILPAAGGAILILISIFLTFIAGLIPSGMAARKDPVVALRTE